MTALTDADGYHTVSFSPDKKYYVDTWSRVDLAPISQLKRTSDASVIMELERGDLAPLVAAGWRAPEAFSAKGRDGKTDIYGSSFVRPTSIRPDDIRSSKASMPGRTAHSCRRRSARHYGMQALAELGFIVVQIDGMGTANRSKAFHDVASKNLKDAGFPDRILWHKAVAKKYPLLRHHPRRHLRRLGRRARSPRRHALPSEFYKAAVAFAGCHDNRMDKIWWNEQWMGWPIGPQYADSSERDARRQPARQAAARRRRARHQRRSVLDDAGRQRADQGEQDIRPAGDAGRGSSGRPARAERALRRSQGLGLLRRQPARLADAGVERTGDVEDAGTDSEGLWRRWPRGVGPVVGAGGEGVGKLGRPVAPADLIDRHAAVVARREQDRSAARSADLLGREVAEDGGRAEQAEGALRGALLRVATLRSTASCCAAVSVANDAPCADFAAASTSSRPSVSSCRSAGGHELAVEEIDERGHADVRGAGRVGARQDAVGGGAGDRRLRRAADRSLAAGGLRAGRRTSTSHPATAPRRRGARRAESPRAG